MKSALGWMPSFGFGAPMCAAIDQSLSSLLSRGWLLQSAMLPFSGTAAADI
jgi:hypothetical protein